MLCVLSTGPASHARPSGRHPAPPAGRPRRQCPSTARRTGSIASRAFLVRDQEESPALKVVGSQATERRTVRVPDPGHLQPPRGGRSRSCADDRLAPTGCQARFLTGQNRGATVVRTRCRCPPWRGKGSVSSSTAASGASSALLSSTRWSFLNDPPGCGQAHGIPPGGERCGARQGATESVGIHSPPESLERASANCRSSAAPSREARPHACTGYVTVGAMGSRGEAWFRPAEADANSPSF